MFRQLLLATVVFTLSIASRAADAPQLESLYTAGLTDLQATVTVLNANQTELRKIGKDFGMAYMLKSVTMQYKTPDKLRMEGKLGLYIENGANRYYNVPLLHIKKRDELSSCPAKRYSLLDVGLLAKNALARTTVKYLRQDLAGEIQSSVFEVTYTDEPNLKYVLWVDPKTRVVRKRERYDGEGNLRATFQYSDVRSVGAELWLPTRLEIKNGDGAVAGVLQYTDLKVNQGLPDSLFHISSARRDSPRVAAR